MRCWQSALPSVTATSDQICSPTPPLPHPAEFARLVGSALHPEHGCFLLNLHSVDGRDTIANFREALLGSAHSGGGGGDASQTASSDGSRQRLDRRPGNLYRSAQLAAAEFIGTAPFELVDITQRFEAVRKVDRIGSPLLVVHGGDDRLIAPSLGRKLYEAAAQPKLFVLVEGGSHHNTNWVGQAQYRQALAQLFSLK